MILRGKIVYLILFLSLFGILITGCEDDGYLTSDDVHLSFSVDTLKFDTIFTTIGSTTKSFRIINNNIQPVLISTIQLAGGDKSAYRLNIDGEMSNEVHDIELPANDSLYIFVELTVDPNGSNQPMIVQDSIIFITNTTIQDIDLIAWGQDFVPIDGGKISTTTWTSQKPYLVYNVAWVDSGEVLSIEPGTQIYFHKSSALAVLGTIRATGTPDMPITFQGDRLETMYDDIPDQWHGVLLFPGEETNVFENVEIKNAKIGLQVGTIEYDGYAKVKLHNVKIQHMAYAGIFAIEAKIDATNTLINDCGYYCATLAGGEFSFTHCTIGNFWGSYSNRKSASVIISNTLIINEGADTVRYSRDLVKANWKNSIIWGNLATEIEFGHDLEKQFNFEFDHCIVRLPDSIYNKFSTNFKAVKNNVDPLFFDYRAYDFQLDTLSPAKDAGLIDFGELVPNDLLNISRLSDKAPDLGVYERIEKKEKK